VGTERDRVVDFLYGRLGIARELQLDMWRRAGPPVGSGSNPVSQST
jgi:hypothetical protein